MIESGIITVEYKAVPENPDNGHTSHFLSIHQKVGEAMGYTHGQQISKLEYDTLSTMLATNPEPQFHRDYRTGKIFYTYSPQITKR